MSGQGRAHYFSMGKRGFKQAVIHLLETEYKIVGSHQSCRWKLHPLRVVRKAASSER